MASKLYEDARKGLKVMSPAVWVGLYGSRLVESARRDAILDDAAGQLLRSLAEIQRAHSDVKRAIATDADGAMAAVMAFHLRLDQELEAAYQTSQAMSAAMAQVEPEEAEVTH